MKDIKDKIVDFNKYCNTCVHHAIEIDSEGRMPEPCNECLDNPVNEHSQRPVKYKSDIDLINAELKRLEKIKEYSLKGEEKHRELEAKDN